MKKQSVHGTQLVMVIIALMATLLMAALDSTIVSTAMKTIVGELQGIELYAWPFTIYMLTSTIVIPISGGLADIFGRKPIFLIGIFTFLAGSALCGLSQSMIFLIFSRGIQGLGGGILMTSVFTVVADLFPPQLRGKYMGIVTSVFALSSIVGPLLGGLITDYLNWRWIFYINIPIGVVAVILMVLFMPNFKADKKTTKIDTGGTIFIILALVPLLLAFTFAGSTYAWGSIQVIGLFVLSAAMMAAFIYVESRACNPIVPLTFFKNREIGVALITGFFANAVFYSAIIYIPYFVQGVLGTSATTSGAVTLPLTIGVMTTSNIVGVFLSHKSTYFRPIMIFAFVFGGIGALLLSMLTADSSYLSVIIYMIIFGAGIGVTMPVVNTNVQNAAPFEQLAAATGAAQFFRMIGATVSSAVFGTVMTTTMARGFLGLDLSGVPERIRAALGSAQVITDPDALSGIIAETPPEQLGAVQQAIASAKDILVSGVSNVFLVGVAISIVGLIISFWFKGAPMQIQHLSPEDEACDVPPTQTDTAE